MKKVLESRERSYHRDLLIKCTQSDWEKLLINEDSAFRKVSDSIKSQFRAHEEFFMKTLNDCKARYKSTDEELKNLINNNIEVFDHGKFEMVLNSTIKAILNKQLNERANSNQR